MICQLKSQEEAVTELSRFEKLPGLIYRNWLGITGKIKKALRLSKREGSVNSGNANNEIAEIPTPLNLKEGEKVKVKPADEIKKLLDQNNKFQGLAFTPVMWQYCGHTYTVKKRMNRVFDERRWKICKVKNIVLLEGVYCDGNGGLEKEWDGCDRLCFIWWKEGWLERV